MKERLLMLLFVLVLGGILTSALVVVDDFTAPMIERNATIRLRSSVLDSLGLPYTEESVDEAFAAAVEVVKRGGRTYYRSADGRLALPYEGSGLWGPITGILAMDSELLRIDGITIMHQEETPGLGSRIADAEYLDQFVKKRIAPLLTVAPGRSSRDNEVDSISGATMSSKAFVTILNDEYDIYAGIMTGGE